MFRPEKFGKNFSGLFPVLSRTQLPEPNGYRLACHPNFNFSHSRLR